MSYPYQIKTAEEYRAAYESSVKDPEGFWAGVAGHFSWRRKWDKVLAGDFRPPRVRWCEGAQLNITENCLDRHLADRGDQPAILWEPNDPEEHFRILSYKELHSKVCQFANVLKNNGLKKGDRV